jgi:hypothetical protein
MGLVKKVDAKAHFAARRGLGIAAAEEASKRVKIGPQIAKPASAQATSAEFLRDFALEHSSRDTPASLIVGLSDRPRVPADPRNLPA